MRTTHVFGAALILASLLGAGCFGTPSYVPAQRGDDVDVPPTMEGGKASTGGQSTTVTPMLATERLVDALPPAPSGWSMAHEAVELLNPVPLPDGTRGEYVAVSLEYASAADDTKTISAVLTDTRGIPALSAFLEAYTDREDPQGYRRHFSINEDSGWETVTYGPQGSADGTGSIVILINQRFILQIDGSAGVPTDMLMNLALATDWGPLK